MRKKIFILLCMVLTGLFVTAQTGVSKRQATEDAFIARMKQFSGADILSPVIGDTTVMSRVEGKEYYVLPGDSYILDEISSATYYQRKGRKFKPLCQRRYPAETIANRLLLTSDDLPEGSLKLKFQKYRYATDSVQISFKQLVQFCHSEGYTTYVGIEHSDAREIKADMFLYSKEKQLLHIVNIICPVKHIAEEGLTAEGMAWLFIPTSNLKELMGRKLPKDFMQRLLKKTKSKGL